MEGDMKRQVIGSLGLCLSLLACWPSNAGADAVINWSENAAKAATAACLHISGNGLAESRMYAMVHAAVHDAVNAIDRRSSPYAFVGQASAGASLDAAVAAAARDVLVSVIRTLPESVECRKNGIAQTKALYAAALALIPNGDAKREGVAVGRSAAAAIIAVRADDGSDQNLTDFDYPQGTKPGEWRFTPDFPFPFAFATDWGNVTPFVLRRSSQFRPPPPYQLKSAKYAADYNEVKMLGGNDISTPSTRTPDQTQIGLFWLESSPLAWNRLARDVSMARGLNPWENARLFALLNLAMADGYIASWEAKYHYRFWRPITAIRLGDTDGNRNTAGVLDWTPLQFTYPIPDHDSGHAVQGGVAAEILTQVFGTDAMAFTACSTTLPVGENCGEPGEVLRSYSSFSQAADENADSRVYVGIHFRHAVEEGTKHGRKIAAYAVHRFLKPSR
jgi:hypothetical protein